MTVCCEVALVPLSSVTFKVTVCGPGDEKLVCTCVPLVSKLPLLSRSQAVDWIEPSGSLELEVNVTRSPELGFCGEKSNDAVGARSPTLIVFVATSVAPLSSVTSSPTVCGPGIANETCA